VVDHHKFSSVIRDAEVTGSIAIDTGKSTSYKNVCYYDWKWYTTSNIWYSSASAGYEYAVVTLYLQNYGDQKITTNPSGWNLIANGLKYGYNSMTFDSSLGYQDIEVVNGGEIETKIVYLVKGNLTPAHLQYDGT